LTDWPDATAIVVANSFSAEVKQGLRKQNVLALTRQEMIEDARGWDMEKQRRAVRALDYYIVRVEAHTGLTERFRASLVDRDIGLDSAVVEAEVWRHDAAGAGTEMGGKALPPTARNPLPSA
jgi:hypothetical protein